MVHVPEPDHLGERHHAADCRVLHGGAAYMVDLSVAAISCMMAIAIGVATLVPGWSVYDRLRMRR